MPLGFIFRGSRRRCFSADLELTGNVPLLVDGFHGVVEDDSPSAVVKHVRINVLLLRIHRTALNRRGLVIVESQLRTEELRRRRRWSET